MAVLSQTDKAISIAASEFIQNEMGLAEIHNNIIPIMIPWLTKVKAKTVLDLGCGQRTVRYVFSNAPFLAKRSGQIYLIII